MNVFGFFMIGYVIGTGSVTTMATAGARYGMSLTWALFLSCFFTAILMIAISRLTIVTDNTIMYNFRIHIHPVISVFVLLICGKFSQYACPSLFFMQGL